MDGEAHWRSIAMKAAVDMSRMGEQITALRAELAGVRARLDAVLASSGARGRYHSLEYSDAVDAAETILARRKYDGPS